jgi:hypothetical protein
MAQCEGGMGAEICSVTEVRKQVSAALQRLEAKKNKKGWPWANLKLETEKALGAKVLGRIGEHLFWLERLGNPSKNPSVQRIDPIATAELKSLLLSVRAAVCSEDLNEQLLWSLERSLRNVYDLVAPGEYVSVAIRKEAASADQRSGKYAEELQSARFSSNSSPLREQDLLVLRKQADDHYDRHERAKAARRKELLWLSSLLLWLLVPALAVATAAVTLGGIDFGWWEVIAALVLGGFGGTLSGMRKLRDQLERITQMDHFRAAVWAQVAAAAGLGLFALILFKAGVLPRIGNGSAWGGLVYAFLAGFSEPFAIQAVTRLVGRT